MSSTYNDNKLHKQKRKKNGDLFQTQPPEVFCKGKVFLKVH